jgi:Ca2+:H+ antiporter
VPNWLYALLLFAPVAIVAGVGGAPPLAVFVLACLGLVPLAGLIGHATGQVALHLGAHYGGLLNATFGNAAELIITLLALRQGLFTLVKASITGSIVGNTLLVLGLALLVGGVRHGLLTFDVRSASLNSALMILAVAGLALPALFSSLVAAEHAPKSSASWSGSSCWGRMPPTWCSQVRPRLSCTTRRPCRTMPCPP